MSSSAHPSENMPSAPICPLFNIDKSGFIPIFHNLAGKHRHVLLVAPPRFGKTQLLTMLESFYDSKSLLNSLLGMEVEGDRKFVTENHKGYSVARFDFARFRGETFEETQAKSGIPLGINGRDYFNLIVAQTSRENKGKGKVLLLDNIDVPSMIGYLNDFQEECIEFMSCFMDALSSSNHFSKIFMTATSPLFLRDIKDSLPPQLFCGNIYDPQMGPFLGFQSGAAQTILDRLHSQMKITLGTTGLYRKFGGYYSIDPAIQIIHPAGILRIQEIVGTSNDLLEICRTNAFSGLLTLLVSLFRKMDLCYEDLLQLIHSSESVEFKRDCFTSTSSNMNILESYSFYDFITLLHDFGLLSYRSAEQSISDMAITNADSLMTLMKLADVFIRERLLQNGRVQAP